MQRLCVGVKGATRTLTNATAVIQRRVISLLRELQASVAVGAFIPSSDDGRLSSAILARQHQAAAEIDTVRTAIDARGRRLSSLLSPALNGPCPDRVIEFLIDRSGRRSSSLAASARQVAMLKMRCRALENDLSEALSVGERRLQQLTLREADNVSLTASLSMGHVTIESLMATVASHGAIMATLFNLVEVQRAQIDDDRGAIASVLAMDASHREMPCDDRSYDRRQHDQSDQLDMLRSTLDERQAMIGTTLAGQRALRQRIVSMRTSAGIRESAAAQTERSLRGQIAELRKTGAQLDTAHASSLERLTQAATRMRRDHLDAVQGRSSPSELRPRPRSFARFGGGVAAVVDAGMLAEHNAVVVDLQHETSLLKTELGACGDRLQSLAFDLGQGQCDNGNLRQLLAEAMARCAELDQLHSRNEAERYVAFSVILALPRIVGGLPHCLLAYASVMLPCVFRTSLVARSALHYLAL